jgi:hypothetical protein
MQQLLQDLSSDGMYLEAPSVSKGCPHKANLTEDDSPYYINIPANVLEANDYIIVI